MGLIHFPKRARGRQSVAATERYEAECRAFCREIRQIASGLDFDVSSRGWCYVLEEHGLLKTNFDAAQKLINDCRKNGMLPLDICCSDDSRTADNIQMIDYEDPQDFAELIAWPGPAPTPLRAVGPAAFWEFALACCDAL
jgi:hypothetical protein